ncbi:PLP-dependent aminotransferase family protein [Streptomyces sp. WAC05374]|uniref:aminotransferase-like domain-containing protein n=1 Tax=Streptomyces sp. WAC05374 TaxID=2487420 RepID=UPI000F873965|nr:PLP-dependent aminotransferase family protein [Streptomyces sp. WAC05374]RST15222.1 PLP-dependent aminotransferase family protein [Streptomyces sp. WAC05374]TDF41097.1 PLP-dependent aminotransferase family protein [Streptomyces sp. WAC05374]TDF49744.1 PLP-dependent aminotransferase family protein [Streptomyces sp. WAC05374]TDF51367.1 PLP-dependent aminotransferase family protein [Streptomyces sp. WAC05374]
MNDSSSSRKVADTLARELERVPAGTRLATHRELVRRFGVSATTVSQALALLTQWGVVTSRPGAGTFRAEARPVQRAGDTSWQEAALQPATSAGSPAGAARGFTATGLLGTLSTLGPDVVDLNGGYLHPTLQPLAMLGTALARAARRPATWDRPAVGGLPELRDWFAAGIGGGLGRDDVLVCGAGQGALATALRALGQPGAPVVVESPTYPGTIAAARAAGLRPVAVPLDAEGLRADHLDEALGRTGARVVIVQPLFQNPTGACLSAARQREILRVARQHGAFVIEDDFARHMAHADAGPTPPPMVADDPDGTVVHIRSLTKVTSPNLRVGALAARGPVMARLRAAHLIDTMFVPAPLQHTALEVVTAPGWKRALATLGSALEQRRKVAADAVSATFGPRALAVRPRGGYHLWVSLPGHLTEERLAAAALAHGVALTPGGHYYATDSGTPHVRISYVAAPSAADVDDAVRRLAPLVTEA